MNAQEIIAEHERSGKYAVVDGLRIFYRCAGPEEGIPLVMTHGIPRSSFLYRKMIPILAKGHPVRAWDLFGFGLSDKPRDRKYGFSQFEQFLGRFLDELGIKRAHLVCHDVGGPFTIGFAARNPEQVATLTIMNTTIFLSRFRIPSLVLASILTPTFLHHLVPDKRYAETTLHFIRRKALKNPDALAGEEAEAFRELATRNGGRWSLIKTVKSYRGAVPYLRKIQRDLEGFARPTLILWGRHDPFCPPPNAMKFHRLIRNSELRILDEASHFLQEDAPEEVSRHIIEFINRSTPGRK
jgi:2-hydroxymuconate-semialdehyde hydrolase